MCVLRICFDFIIVISSFKCCFDKVFNLRPEADEGLCASLYRCYVLD